MADDADGWVTPIGEARRLRLRRSSGGDPPNLDIIEPASLQDKPVPPRRWRVHGWIADGTVTALYGDGGVGKSLLAQMLMTAAATGAPGLGSTSSGVECSAYSARIRKMSCIAAKTR